MVERGMNILLAMPPQPDEEHLLEGIRHDFEEAGIPVGRLELRTTKTLVKQYLEMFEDTDAVIVTEHQANDSYNPRELDQLSIYREGICLIPILDEPKGGAFVRQLESLGIYTAVFEDNSDYGTIAGILTAGRTKREARAYYGIEGIGIVEDSYDAENAVRYLTASAGDYSQLESRLAFLSDRLGSTRKMLEVLGRLPEETFTLVSRMDAYRELCRLLKEERESHKPIIGDTGGKPSKGEEGKKATFGQQPGHEDLRAAEHRLTVDIGFVSTNMGVGCTHAALLLAHSLQIRRRARVAVVEFDNCDEHFRNLCRISMGAANVSGITCFTIGDVDYYFNTPYSRFVTQSKPLYDYVVYDFGCADDEAVERYFLGLCHKFVVTGGADWRLGEFSEFVDAVAKKDLGNSFVYLIPFSHKQDVGNFAGLVPENRVVPLPCENNPYRPGKKTQVLFERLIDGTWNGSGAVREVGFEEKVSRKPQGARAGLGVLAAVLCSSLLFGGMTSAMVTGSFHKQASNEQMVKIEELEKTIEAESRENVRLSEELERLQIITYSLKQPVPAGTLITEKEVEEVGIRSSLTAGAYLGKGDLGKVQARTELAAGVPIYLCDVEVYTPEPVPAEEQTQAVSESGETLEGQE